MLPTSEQAPPLTLVAESNHWDIAPSSHSREAALVHHIQICCTEIGEIETMASSTGGEHAVVMEGSHPRRP